MAVRIAKKEDKSDIFTTMAYSFNSGNGAINENLNKEHDYDKILVNEENGVVTSAVVINKYNIMFDDKEILMGGVGGVCSKPEDRSSGGVKNILTYSLKYMKDRNIIFSALGPFAFEFYRKYGWEWTFAFQLVEIPIEKLKDFPSAHKYVQFTKNDKEIFNDFRNMFIKNINGPVKYNEELLEEKWNAFYNSFSHVYGAYDESDNLLAIACYKIEGRLLRCEELFFKNEKGRQNILHFFYRHRSQVDNVELQLLRDDDIRNILPTPRIKFWEWPNMMGRVVVVDEFLKLMKIKNAFKPFKIKVNDTQAEWNNHTFLLSCVNNQMDVAITTAKPDFEMSIQRFSQIAIGFLSGKDAIKLDLIKVNNDKKVNEFEKAFTKRPCMLWHKF